MIDGEPSGFEEVVKQECWHQAMIDELTSIEDNNTWELTVLLVGHRPIGLKWVFKSKKDENGIIIKHKARLIAKGYVQMYGVNYEEVFAPVARLESVRLLLTLAGHKGWAVHHMDVKTAFLNGELSEEVYVSQPPGFVQSGEEQKVYRLQKALYGLKQAPRCWNEKLDNCLSLLGFFRSSCEHAVYIRKKEKSRLVVGVYVDDLIITGDNEKEIKTFKSEMSSSFKMSDLGLLSFYLGIEVKQSSGGITVNQSAYANKILEKGGLEDCNPCQTPMGHRLKLSKTSSAPAVDEKEYRSLVGSLRYLVNTRPDISFAVGYVSRFLEKPTAEHMGAVKHILRYVAGTRSYGCKYGRATAEPCLLGYCDSDFAGDIDDRRSTTGVLFFLGSSVISWQSQKQRIVTLSSCEAKYVAATTAACQCIWLVRLLADMKGEEVGTVRLQIDNKSAISLSKNPVFHDRSKHIQTRYHFIRGCVEDKTVEVDYIRTEDQLADILTKQLGKIRFQELCSRIGIINTKETQV